MAYTGRLQTYGRDDVEAVGGKAANLGELARAGQPVPPGFVVTTESYQAFVDANGLAAVIAATQPTEPSDEAYRRASETIRAQFVAGTVDPKLRRAVLAAYARIDRGPVAVRSSATAEDLADASFAGQQDTYLNVEGDDAVLDAVRRCWASLWTARAMAYRDQRGIEAASVRLAVVVQRLVDADAAGVMFTANPANGRRNQTLISAAWGLGEAVVSGLVNTDQITVDTAGGRVLASEVADKTVQTVRTPTGTQERPVPAERRRARVLDDAAALELARVGGTIAAHFGVPQDIEWARSGDEFFVLQSRPITALPLPEADPPTEWLPPKEHTLYVRASITEQLPDPLTPLFADLIDGSVARSLQDLFGELLGRNPVRPGDVGLPTINGYAYYAYDSGAMRRMFAVTPRVFGVLSIDGPRSGINRWRTRSHPKYRRIVDSWSPRPLAELSSPELLSGVRELLDAGTEYYTAVQTVIPVAASSETILTRFYETLIRRHGDPSAETFVLGFDSEPIRAEKSLYDLAQWVAGHPELRATVLASDNDELLARLGADAADESGEQAGDERDESSVREEFADRFAAHLDHYGHAVYNMDFANPVAADDPGPLLDTVRFYLRGGGQSPYDRQARLAERREQAVRTVRERLDPARLALFDRLIGWAQTAAPIREDALADIGLAWPVLRRVLHELGVRAVASGVIDDPGAVFWLHWDELVAALTPAEKLPDPMGAEIEQRKELWRGRRRATPPQWLPKGTWMDWMENWLPATTQEQTGNVLTGIGGSAGKVTATARVLGGPEDFGRLEPGDVLVASITTPAWTSLFARASAVVTDIGGPLSHSSIVAREYGIPAVLGTNVATRRIVDGSTVTVDGDAGKVILPGDPDQPPAPAETDGSHRKLAIALAAGGVLAAGTAVLVRRRRRADPAKRARAATRHG
ncbi:PEP/pyruvate-binding domain-containing protein [Microlunatus ginsengisoli]|uniref:PEP/pyruvate-binding domain-containing protein n=1 Tax=Microlunatus ginsengisoli TaxID=363863 RepID=A0ABP6ZY30_9ACTN